MRSSKKKDKVWVCLYEDKLSWWLKKQNKDRGKHAAGFFYMRDILQVCCVLFLFTVRFCARPSTCASIIGVGVGIGICTCPYVSDSRARTLLWLALLRRR